MARKGTALLLEIVRDERYPKSGILRTQGRKYKELKKKKVPQELGSTSEWAKALAEASSLGHILQKWTSPSDTTEGKAKLDLYQAFPRELNPKR